jgi:hypothetical protein
MDEHIVVKPSGGGEKWRVTANFRDTIAWEEYNVRRGIDQFVYRGFGYFSFVGWSAARRQGMDVPASYDVFLETIDYAAGDTEALQEPAGKEQKATRKGRGTG